MHDLNCRRWKVDTRVQFLDGWIAPCTDFAEKDCGQGWAIQHELPRLHAGNIHNRHNTANHDWELDQACSVQLICRERFIGSAKRYSLGLDLGDTCARTDR